MVEGRAGDDLCDSDDDLAGLSEASYDADLPSEVDETIDVIECNDGSVAALLAADPDDGVVQLGSSKKVDDGAEKGCEDVECSWAAEKSNGVGMQCAEGEEVGCAEANCFSAMVRSTGEMAHICGPDDLIPRHDDNEGETVADQKVGRDLLVGVESSVPKRPDGTVGDGTTLDKGMGDAFVRYSRRKKEGRARNTKSSLPKHARILSKLNLSIAPIKKQLIIGGIPRSSRPSLGLARKEGGTISKAEMEGDSLKATMRHRVSHLT